MRVDYQSYDVIFGNLHLASFIYILLYITKIPKGSTIGHIKPLFS